MSPYDIVLAITQIARVWNAYEAFKADQILDADITLWVSQPVLTDDEYYYNVINSAESRKKLVDEFDVFDEYIDVAKQTLRKDLTPELRQKVIEIGRDLYTAYLQETLQRNGKLKDDRIRDAGCAATIRALRDDKQPDAWGRFGIELLKITLDTVKAKPELFRASAEGHKLIAAMASNVVTLLPDPKKVEDWQTSFAERAMSILLTAGVQTMEQNVDIIWDQTRLRELGRGLLKPLSEKMTALTKSESGARAYELFRIKNVRDELLAPMARSALGVVAEHQAAFLGRSFRTDRALGAVTEQFFKTALEDTDGSILRVFGNAGYLRFYERVLGLVGEKPELFIHGKSDTTKTAQDILGNCARALANAPLPYRGDAAAQVAAAALEAVAKNIPALLDAEEGWDKVGADVLQNIVTGFAAGLKGGKENAFATMFSREQSVEIVRIIATHVAETPGLLIGEKANKEVQRITAHIATLISTTRADLFSAENWSAVIGVIMREAAANPGALFSIDDDNVEKQVALRLLSGLFKEAADIYENGGRRPGLRLFGQTLVEAASAVLKAAVRNAAQAATQKGLDAANALARRLNALAIAHPDLVSDRDWRFLYSNWIAHVIEKGELPTDWDDDKTLIDMLYLNKPEDQRPAPPASPPTQPPPPPAA